MTHLPPLPDPHGLDALIRTALHDPGGGMAEHAFADQWVPHAERAAWEIAAAFRQHGFSSADAERFRRMMRNPDTPPDPAFTLLRHLHPWTRTLAGEMLTEPLPQTRALALRLAAALGSAAPELTQAFGDPDAQVRKTALECLASGPTPLKILQPHIRALLSDPDPAVQLAAVRAVGLLDDPEGGAALLRWLSSPLPGAMTDDALRIIAQRLTQYEASAEPLEQRVHLPLLHELIALLQSPHASRRSLAALALQRVALPEAAQALFRALLTDSSPDVRRALLRNPQFRPLGSLAQPHMIHLAGTLQEPAAQYHAVQRLEALGGAALAPHLTAMTRPDLQQRRDAAQHLGSSGLREALPVLAHALVQPENQAFSQEIIASIRQLAALPQAFGEAQQQALEMQLACRLDGLALRGASGIEAYCRQLQALPLHSAPPYLWAQEKTGGLLCLDLDAYGLAPEPETSPLLQFAVRLHGAQRYPELYVLIPPCPEDVQGCSLCSGRGWIQTEPEALSCMTCAGIGWHSVPPGPPRALEAQEGPRAA